MDIIQNDINTDFGYQVSTLCIANMPDDRFCIDRKFASNIWHDFTINTIWLTYFSLILKGIIKIEVKVQLKDILFGLVKWESKCFIPRLIENTDLKIDLGWFENSIISSINNRHETDKLILKEQIRALANITLGFDDKYNSPYSELLQRIMLYDNHKYWDCTFDDKLFNTRRYIVLKIFFDVKSRLQLQLTRIIDYERDLVNDNSNLKDFRSKFKKIVRQEFGKKVEFHPEDYQ